MSWERTKLLIAFVCLLLAGGAAIAVSQSTSSSPSVTSVSAPRTVPINASSPNATLELEAVTTFVHALDAHALVEGFARAEADEFTALVDAELARQAAVARSRPRASAGGSRPCGYGTIPAQLPDAIPSRIVTAESNHTLDAQNCTSSASGKYQFLDSTWNGYGGYARAADAPEAVQDAKARELWAGGAGCSHWSACG